MNIRWCAVWAISVVAAWDVLAQTMVSPEDFRADIAILVEAYEALHPGLSRYLADGEFAELAEQAVSEFDNDLTLAEAYLSIARLTAAVRCGHTYPNFFNQSDAVSDEVFDKADKLPFAFRIVDGQMLVTASADDAVEMGSIITAIDGVPIPNIVDALLPYIRADGSNDAKRRQLLDVSGVGSYESFDVFFPLLFPAKDGAYTLTIEGRGDARVRAMTMADRRKALSPETDADSLDHLWEFRHINDDIAYLKLGTFVTWRMEMNWLGFLRDAFDELNERGTPNLIIDIRGNEGGDDAPYRALLRYLTKETLTLDAFESRLTFESVPASISEYIETWGDDAIDYTGQLQPLDDGFYTWTEDAAPRNEIRPAREPYEGEVHFLVDAANSSGGFFLAHAVKYHRLATLAGQTTGGNLRGINGGNVLFLRLPNTGIEVDLPIIGYFSKSAQPDQGLEPDIVIEPDTDAIREGIDGQLNALISMISG